MKNKLIFTLSCVAAALLLQGCSSTFDKYNDHTLFEKVPGVRTMDEQKQQAFTRYDAAFLGKQVAYSEKQQHLLAQRVDFRSGVPVSLDMVLSTIATQTKSSFRINERAPGADDKAGTGGAISDHNVSFSGSFEEFIRYLSVLYDVTLTLTDNNILQVDVYKTYALKLDYFGASEYDSGLDMGGNAATSDGGIKGQAQNKFSSTFWEDVSAMATKYVSSGVFNIFKDVGVLTFSGRPSEYNVLARILKDYKQDSNKQFIITYKVFVLSKDKVRKLGADASLAFSKGGTVFNLNSPVGAGVPSGGEGGIGLERIFSGNLDVSAKLNALYELTGSKVLESGTVVTRNNTPVPLNLTRSRNYVSGVTSTLSGAATSFISTAISTDTIVTGTSVLLIPRVLSDGRVQVTSAYTRKDLEGEPEVFGGKDNQVQLPKISTTELLNTVDVVPGSLITVSSYEIESNGDKQGVHLLGGNMDRSKSNQTVVMVVGVDYYNNPFQEGR